MESMHRLATWGAAATLVLIGTGSARADLTVTAQSRSLEVSGAVPTDSIVAPNDLPFVQTLTKTVTATPLVDPPVDPFDITATAQQNSSFGFVGAEFVVQATGSADISSDEPRTGLFAANAFSRFSVTFTLDAPAAFTLERSGAGSPSVSVLEVDLDGLLSGLEPIGGPDGTGITTSDSGTLDPGTYTMRAVAGYEGETLGQGTDFSFTLRVTASPPPSVAVPLPPAIWSESLVLGALGLCGFVRRKRKVAHS